MLVFLFYIFYLWNITKKGGDPPSIEPAENGVVGRIKLVLIGRSFRESAVTAQFEKALTLI